MATNNISYPTRMLILSLLKMGKRKRLVKLKELDSVSGVEFYYHKFSMRWGRRAPPTTSKYYNY